MRDTDVPELGGFVGDGEGDAIESGGIDGVAIIVSDLEVAEDLDETGVGWEGVKELWQADGLSFEGSISDVGA